MSASTNSGACRWLSAQFFGGPHDGHIRTVLTQGPHIPSVLILDSATYIPRASAPRDATGRLAYQLAAAKGHAT